VARPARSAQDRKHVIPCGRLRSMASSAPASATAYGACPTA
jgi:hypothetical protein